DGRDIDTLLRHADAALYHAKALGRNNYQFFTRAINERISEYLVIENGLRRALDRQEFELHYQPQIDMRSGKLIGVEALLRWKHPEQGL
ncbi:EAL domain-containing protein, partial [Staphylococcus aureus]|nr:EAL domain-containing protein [Staphylococcus aureus]